MRTTLGFWVRSGSIRVSAGIGSYTSDLGLWVQVYHVSSLGNMMDWEEKLSSVIGEGSWNANTFLVQVDSVTTGYSIDPIDQIKSRQARRSNWSVSKHTLLNKKKGDMGLIIILALSLQSGANTTLSTQIKKQIKDQVSYVSNHISDDYQKKKKIMRTP